jgi:sulfite reductase alpha subunit-like flavoprotein
MIVVECCLAMESLACRRGVKLGPAALFNGIRTPAHDYIYQQELEGFEKAGLLDVSM